MAVTNFHYITRMSSGFKVYILEGQPNMRTEDRYRHMTNEKARISPIYPIKRKHSPDRIIMTGDRCGKSRRPPLALTSRQRVFQNLACSIQRLSSLSSSGSPDSPPTPSSAAMSSPWSPNPSPDRPLSPALSPMYSTPPMDEPLALIKKPRRDQDGADAKAPSMACSPVQVRPSVITRVSSMACPPQQLLSRPPAPVVSPAVYDHVVEEHFRRSLGVNYHKASSCQLAVNVSVDDHFAKALGEKWFQIKASSSSSPSSSPATANPGFRLSSRTSQSANDRADESTSKPGSPSTSCHPSSWSDKGQNLTNK